jgi:hypothetical protein
MKEVYCPSGGLLFWSSLDVNLGIIKKNKPNFGANFIIRKMNGRSGLVALQENVILKKENYLHSPQAFGKKSAENNCFL